MSANTNIDLAPQRQARITDILRLRPVVKVNDLCEALGVSPASVRRDLAAMEERGDIRRVHGGAMAVERRQDEPLFDDKTSIATEQKRAIAEAALRFTQPHDSVFLDGGSTVLALAALLTDRTQMAVVTNSLRVAVTLSGAGPHTILTGGELRRVSQTFVGSLTQPLLQQVHVDKAFMGTIGLSATAGMTTTDAREALTKETVMAHARRIILLADSSKIDKISFVNFGRLEAIDTLITDKGARSKDLKPFEKLGIEIVRA